jgi:fructose-bisphosphate aldolase, class II
MLISGKTLLQKAKRGSYAVGAFNTNNLETTKAIISAATEMNSPVFLQMSSGALKYGGFELAALSLAFAKNSKIPVAVHLDHGPTVDLVKKCTDFGFSSIMIDGSHYKFTKNVSVTKKAAALAHKKGVSVESELGRLKGREDEVFSAKHSYTDPDQAVKFVKLTKTDSLAVAIGTSHGAYKFGGTPQIDLKRLSEIADVVNIPLVLHGASSVPASLVSEANSFGAKISGAKGVPEKQIKQAVKLGICKVNEDTDLRLAFTGSVRKFLKKNPSKFDPREILSPATEAMKKVVMRRIKVLGSANKK